MPEIFHRPIERRSALRIGTLAGLGALVGMPRLFAAGEDSESLHLALLSDTHVPGDQRNAHGQNPWNNLKRIIPEVVAARPDGVIVNGDAARTEGLEEDYRELKALLSPAAAITPVYIGMGNHDDRANFHKVFSEDTHASEVKGKCVLVIEHALVRVLVLDSLLYVNRVAGFLGKAQRSWLLEYLERNKDRPVVLFVHHTLGDNDGDLLDADRMFGILERHPQVKAVFYGHSHVWSLSRRKALHLVNLPAVGYSFSDKQPLGWVDARLDGSGADLTLRAFGGNLHGNGGTTRIEWA